MIGFFCCWWWWGFFCYDLFTLRYDTFVKCLSCKCFVTVMVLWDVYQQKRVFGPMTSSISLKEKVKE